ncbi:MAG: MOSC domain-containing protein [Alphaproteobacteria bacterium]
MPLTLNLLATSVGLPAPLGEWQGERVISSIRKTPLSVPAIAVDALNILGDQQSDLTVHGGIDKAVYAYPVDHWPWWQSAGGFAAGLASFGENLTVTGATEGEIRIGDKFVWGDVELEVSQPRAPCYKFVMLTGRQDMATRMTVSGRTGWYYRVLKTGTAPTAGSLTRTSTDAAMPTVREALMALFHPRIDDTIVEKVLGAVPLAKQWRAGVRQRRRS